jgi:ferric-dicitrate binding protein FerR (iron transport regulator)
MPVHPPYDPSRERRRERVKTIAAGAVTAALVGYLVWAGIQAILAAPAV